MYDILQNQKYILQVLGQGSGGGPSTNVTETNSANILTATQAIENSISLLESIAAPRTKSIVRSSSTGVSPANLMAISFANAGTVNCLVDGSILKPGEAIDFNVEPTIFPTNFSWDATGSDLLITMIIKL